MIFNKFKLSNFSENFKNTNFLKELKFYKNLYKILEKKNIILSDYFISSEQSQSFIINLKIFYKTKFFNKFRKLKFTKPKNCTLVLNKKLYNLIITQLNISCINKILFNFLVLNKFCKKSYIFSFYEKHKKYTNFLYARRHGLYYDLAKIISLLLRKKINSSSFLKVIIHTFYVLPKKKHSKFLFFLKDIFKFLITTKSTPILGVKLLINGKLKGKTKASKAYINIGKVPIQTIKSNISFAKAHAFTKYGVFGFKIWIYFI